jgi:hypothetical protein
VAGREVDSILEIGGGYGRTGHALLSVFPAATYIVVDIEPAPTVSEWYLSQLLPSRRLRFLRPEAAPSLPDESVSLAVSISSLPEMTRAQAEGYIHLLDRVAAGGIVYLKQWSAWHNPADDVTLRFKDYPVPERWRNVFDHPAPVQTAFREAAWSVPARPERSHPDRQTGSRAGVDA